MAHVEQNRVNVVAPEAPGAPAPQVAPGPVVQPERQAPAVVNHKAPRRAANRTNTNPGVHPLIHGVANIPFYTIQGATSTYVPDSTTVYNALESMDIHMATIRRFYENSPSWNPLVSQAYIGVIWTIHVLRCSQSAGHITQQQSELLTWFEGMYPYQNLPVPGPLVPFFQSLGVCSGPFEAYGDVTPVLPEQSGARATAWFYAHGHSFLLPPVHVFVDQLIYLSQLNPNIIAASGTHAIRIYTNIFGEAVGAAGAVAAHHAVLGYYPGIANRWHITPQHIQAWHTSRHALSLPPRMIIPAVPNPNPLGHVRGPNAALGLGEMLRFATAGRMHCNWFSQVVSTMQRYSQFFANSTSMAGINTAGFGASIPIWKPLATSQRVANRDPVSTTVATHSSTAAAAVNMNYLVWPITSNQPATGHLNDPTMVPNMDGSDPNRLARQYSAVSQVNVSFTNSNPGDAYNTIPLDAALRSGPIWNLTELATSPAVDNTIVIPQNILGMFVADTRHN